MVFVNMKRENRCYERGEWQWFSAGECAGTAGDTAAVADNIRTGQIAHVYFPLIIRPEARKRGQINQFL